MKARIAVSLALLLAVSGAAPAAATPATEPALASTRTAASQAGLARSLAARVTRARTATARYRGLLSVMDALSVGVITGRGRVLVRGAPPRGFYLYDFELRALAAALGRRDSVALADIARSLSAVGVRARGRRALTPDRLAGALRAGVRRYRSGSRSGSALPALLARELGLRHRRAQDLAKRVPADSLRLDPLQHFLVTADIAVGLTRGRAFRPRPPRPATGGGQAAATTPPRAAGDPCAGLVESIGPAGESTVKFGKWILPFLIKKAGKPIRAATAVLDVAHAGLLSLMLDYQAARGGQSHHTHYGPAGHVGFSEGSFPGLPLVFQVGVQMVADIPAGVVNCGRLAGLKIPKKGPVAGVPISWNPLLAGGGYKKLKAHGSITREDRETGRDGLAILIFQPRDEKYPELGELKRESDVLQPTARLFTVFGNVLAYVAEAIPPFVTFGWSVEYHDNPNLFDVFTRGSAVFTQDEGSGTDQTHHRGEFTWNTVYRNVIVPRDGKPSPQSLVIGPESAVQGTATFDQTNGTLSVHCTAPMVSALAPPAGPNSAVTPGQGGYDFRVGAAVPRSDDERRSCSGDLNTYGGLPLYYEEAVALDALFTLDQETLNTRDSIEVTSVQRRPFDTTCIEGSDDPCSQSLMFPETVVTLVRVTPDGYQQASPP